MACLKQSGYSHASIVIEQVLVLLELSNVKIYLESIAAALENVVGVVQQKHRGAGWHIGVIIRDLERLTANLQHSQAGHAAGQNTLHTAPQHQAAQEGHPTMANLQTDATPGAPHFWKQMKNLMRRMRFLK
ncbi:MAG: hypothetical protein FWC18_02520 [Cystobacterineae bacterium]|nr:hypothetical protein [Cystobacterineae bacterium]